MTRSSKRARMADGPTLEVVTGGAINQLGDADDVTTAITVAQTEAGPTVGVIATGGAEGTDA